MNERFNVIVVGAGVAGLTAAYVLARNGFDVMVLERGNSCGEKNVSGGAFCGDSFQRVFRGVSAEAPIERHIKRRVLSCVSGHSVVSYDYCSGAKGHGLGFTVLRAEFDSWLGKQAVEAGAEILNGVTVDDVVFDGGVARGVSVDGEELYSNVVLLSEGANATLTEKIGFREKLQPIQAGLGVKQVIRIDENTINERFNVDSAEGVAIELFGTFTQGIEGGGFIYTNKDSVSLGLVFALSSYGAKNSPPYEILERFKRIPYVAKLIRAGETVEYSAHLVPEVGVGITPRVYGNGILVAGDAAGFAFKNGRTVEGMNYAVESGKLAADTVIRAAQFNDYSEKTLSEYREMIRCNRLFKRLMRLADARKFFENPRLYKEYPRVIGEFSKMLFGEGIPSDSGILGLLSQAAQTSGVTVRRMAFDMMRSRGVL
ncbi:MAG: FAD-dependent oxidoreductase [Planctomycetota bacterium]|jgi:electron transfer flavoprotein-quinone oxidoreductase